VQVVARADHAFGAIQADDYAGGEEFGDFAGEDAICRVVRRMSERIFSCKG
jgi:hypothetical protein